MPLPFLDRKAITTNIISRRGKPDVEVKSEVDMSKEDPGLKACAEDLLRAIESKSVSDLVSALKNCFEMLESQPMEEESQGE